MFYYGDVVIRNGKNPVVLVLLNECAVLGEIITPIERVTIQLKILPVGVYEPSQSQLDQTFMSFSGIEIWARGICRSGCKLHNPGAGWTNAGIRIVARKRNN